MSAIALLLFVTAAYAETAPGALSDPQSVQPYLESLKKKYDLKPTPAPPPSPPSPTAQKIEDNSTNPNQVQPYLEKLREDHGLGPSQSAAPTGAKDTNSAQAMQPYLETLKKGKELEPKYKKIVDQAAGISVVASDHFDITSSDAQANPFQSVYNPDGTGKYNPSADFFYERQVYRSRYFGSFGPIGHLGFITTAGKGIFTKTGAQSSDTIFHFYALPISLGGSYRLSQLRFIVPFVQAAGMVIPFEETRNDNKAARHGYSKAYSANVGVAFNLDWVSRKKAWDQYDSNEVLHTYLMAQYEFIRSFASVVQFNYNGLYAGLLFEF